MNDKIKTYAVKFQINLDNQSETAFTLKIPIKILSKSFIFPKTIKMKNFIEYKS